MELYQSYYGESQTFNVAFCYTQTTSILIISGGSRLGYLNISYQLNFSPNYQLSAKKKYGQISGMS